MNTYVRMLFVDFSSAFNTIIPQHLVSKLGPLGLGTPLCSWLLDFFNRETSVCEGWKSHLKCHLSEHRLPSGLRPEPITVYYDDP